jgi:hypothetical protein
MYIVQERIIARILIVNAGNNEYKSEEEEPKVGLNALVGAELGSTVADGLGVQ